MFGTLIDMALCGSVFLASPLQLSFRIKLVIGDLLSFEIGIKFVLHCTKNWLSVKKYTP